MFRLQSLLELCVQIPLPSASLLNEDVMRSLKSLVHLCWSHMLNLPTALAVLVSKLCLNSAFTFNLYCGYQLMFHVLVSNHLEVPFFH